MNEDQNNNQLKEIIFTGREEFKKQINIALKTAAEKGAKEGFNEIIITDTNYFDWDLGSGQISEYLQKWALNNPQAKFTILATDYEKLQQIAPRFINWRKQWSHKITARLAQKGDEEDMPSGLYTEKWIIQRFEKVHSSGIVSQVPAKRISFYENIKKQIKQSSSGLQITTLGL